MTTCVLKRRDLTIRREINVQVFQKESPEDKANLGLLSRGPPYKMLRWLTLLGEVLDLDPNRPLEMDICTDMSQQ